MDFKLFEDGVTILSIFPKINLQDLYCDLLNLATQKDRIKILLKRYLLLPFATCNVNDDTFDDMRKIRRIFPNIAFSKIIEDINKVGCCQNRVQIIIKSYFDEQPIVKRTMEEDCESNLCNKKRKYNDNGVGFEEAELNKSQKSFRDILNDLLPGMSQQTHNICEKLKLDLDEVPDCDKIHAVIDNLFNNYEEDTGCDTTTNIKEGKIDDSAPEQKVKSENSQSSNKVGEQVVKSQDTNDKFTTWRDCEQINNSNLLLTREFYPTAKTYGTISRCLNQTTNNQLESLKPSTSKLPSHDTNLKSIRNYIRESKLCPSTRTKPERTQKEVKETTRTFIHKGKICQINPGTSTQDILNIISNNKPEDKQQNLEMQSVNGTPYNEDDEVKLISVQEVEDPVLRKRNELYNRMLNCHNDQLIAANTGVKRKKKKGILQSAQFKKGCARTDLYQDESNSPKESVYSDSSDSSDESYKIKYADYRFNTLQKQSKEKCLNSASDNGTETKNIITTFGLILKPALDLPVQENQPLSIKLSYCKEKESEINAEPSSSGNKKDIDIYAPGSSKTYPNHPFVFKLLEMFPDACPNFLREKCHGVEETDQNFGELTNFFLGGDYERRSVEPTPNVILDFEEQYKILLDVFPDADPTYLQQHCERLIDNPTELQQFVNLGFERKNYPSKEDYLKKIKLTAQEIQYTEEFNVKNFLEIIPNPEEYFTNPTRKSALHLLKSADINYAKIFLNNQYRHVHTREIQSVFVTHDHNLIEVSNILECFKKTLRTKRKLYPITTCSNIPLLQEIAYIKHKKEIMTYIKEQEEKKTAERQKAKEMGLLKTCDCCYDDEVMPDETAFCNAGHMFCKTCIRKNCEILIGQGRLSFPCLTTCEGEFTLYVLQTILTPKVFSKLAQKTQLEEVKAAGIEDLEFCPMCDFATIPAPDDKVFRCLNSECMKESCRQCKEPSHIPLRCDEVEREHDVKLRTYIENKMTEALVRVCYKCGMKFVKEDGCNKMTCHCGAMMCYICNAPVKDYKHFNGQGGLLFHLCPLYSDTVQLHMDEVKRGAQKAKKELGIETNEQLKIDPAKNLENHFGRKPKDREDPYVNLDVNDVYVPPDEYEPWLDFDIINQLLGRQNRDHDMLAGLQVAHELLLEPGEPERLLDLAPPPPRVLRPRGDRVRARAPPILNPAPRVNRPNPNENNEQHPIRINITVANNNVQ